MILFLPATDVAFQQLFGALHSEASIVRPIGQVVTVSVETVKLVKSLPALE